MARGRFAMAVHAMALLAGLPDGACSAILADSVNTHAAYLRRVLSRLAQAGLIEAREGRDGGYRLAAPPDRISLGAIYRATIGEPAIPPSPAAPNPLCPASRAMGVVFAGIARGGEDAMIAWLDARTLADVTAGMERATG
ncbi:MAG: RrF2 family transcriptional regulator [Chloroflexota bacterium]